MATTIQSTTNSTSTSTGALVTLGGVGIAKDLFVGGSLSISGDVHITGVVTNEPLNRLVTKQKLLENELGNLSNELAALARAQEYNDLILETAELSAANSATSALTAAQSKIDAVNAMNDAIQAKIDAVAKAGEAAGSASQSATSATNAANSATGAGNSATAAQTSANSAGTYATNAGNSAALAQSKADLAAASESAAGNSATAAANSATSASTSAGNAATSAAASVQSYNKLSAKIDLIESNFGAASANLTDNLLVLVDANSQTAQHLEKLESNFTANNISTNATISNLATTVTTGDSANATSISNLTATVNTKNRTFKQGTAPTASAVGDVWIDTSNGNIVKYWDGSSWTESSDTRIATNAAAITTEATARANGDSANASSITTLSTTVGGHTTSISTLTSTTNGLNARWGVTVNNNGSISGIVLNSTGASNGGTPTTAVVIAADKFAVVDPVVNYTAGTTPPAANCPFEIVGGTTVIKSAAIRQNISSYNFNAGSYTGWNIDRNGNILTYGSLEIRDTSGNIVLSTGANAGVEWAKVNNKTGTGNNKCFNASWSLGHDGWWDTWSLDLGGWNIRSTTNVGTLWISQGAPDGVSKYLYNDDTHRINVEPGKNYECSVYTGAHRCTVYCHHQYFDAAGTSLGGGDWAAAYDNLNAATHSGGTSLSGYKRIYYFSKAPANAATVRMVVVKQPTNAGQIDSYAFATMPFVGEMSANQTIPSPWSEGTSANQKITSTNASTYVGTGAIADVYISSLNASKIQAKTLTASKIVNNSLNKYSYAFAATGGTLTNATFSSAVSLAKTFTHRDDGDILILNMTGSCGAGSVSNRQIGFSVEKSGGAVAYYWNSGAGNYVSLPTTRDVSVSREIGLLSYYSTVNNNSQNTSATISRIVAYNPSFSDIYTYIGHIVVVSGTINIHFCISQSSGSNKTATEVNLTVMDTYA